ncbi:MAG: trypsin-like peptidase domain-containing protein [Planctomycetaceae bacterium]
MTSFLRLAFTMPLVVAGGAANADDAAAMLAAIEERTVALIEQVEPSVVSIVRGRVGSDRVAAERINAFAVPGRIGPGRFNGFPQFPQPSDAEFIPEQFGAGVVISDEAGTPFILTSHHVVQDGPVAGQPSPDNTVRIYVRFHDRRGYYASIHASDPRGDLAVLRIDMEALGGETPAGLNEIPKPLELSDAEQYRKGQFVLVLGNPYAVGRDGSTSVGWGLIGNVLRRPAPAGPMWDAEARKDETIHHYGTLLQLDCRADLGFSGGATVDRNGKLIGVTTALAALDGYESTAGFAIPIDAGIRRIIGELLQGHEAEYGFLGVQPGDVTAAQLRVLAPEIERAGGAVRADSVKAGSPAHRAGVKTGDLILAIDGRPARMTHDLMRDVGLAGPGAELELEIVRLEGGRGGNVPQTVSVRLDKWPVANDEGVVATVPRYEPWHGLRVDYATSRQRFVSPQFEPYPTGVVVLEAGEVIGGDDPVGPGDFIEAVNGQAVETPEEFYNRVRTASTVTLRLADGRQVVVK